MLRAAAYWLCAVLVALPGIHWLLHLLLRTQLPRVPLLDVLFLFGSIVPPMFAVVLPRPLLYVATLATHFLVLRRAWLLSARREGVPSSFKGFPKVLGLIGFWSFTSGALGLLASIALRAPSGVPAGLLLIPAMFCVPWAFFLTEILSMRRPRAEESAWAATQPT